MTQRVFMFISNDSHLRFLLAAILLGISVFPGGKFAIAQEPTLPRSQIVVIGKLNGRDDPRQLTLQVGKESFLLEAGGNGKPFDYIKRSAQLFSVIFQLPMVETRGSVPLSMDLRPRGVDFRFFPTDRSLISAVILEEVDYTTLESELSAEDIQKATTKYRILPVKPESNTVEMICYNAAHAILRERALRQALSYAVNREKMVRQFLLNRADLARGPFEKESRSHASGLKAYDYDPKKAITILEALGWHENNKDRIRTRNGQPLRFRLLFPEGMLLKEQIVRQIKIDWNQIGIDVVPVPVSAAALNDSLQRGRFDAVLLRKRFEESAAELIEFFGDGSGRGNFNYANAAFLHTANLSRNFLNENGRRQVVLRMQVLLNEDQLATFLFHPWLTIHIINAAKFENYLNQEGLPRPFNEWVIRKSP